MPRSLLDGANLPLLRSLARQGPATALAAALIDTGLLAFDPDDPDWDDRDRLIVCGAAVTDAVHGRLAAAGADGAAVVTTAALGGDALALAFGAATASRMDGVGWRCWCVIGAEGCEDGRVWEVARAAHEAGAEGLGVLIEGNATAALWRACGWTVHESPATDPVWLLGGLDQLVAHGPGVVMAVPDD